MVWSTFSGAWVMRTKRVFSGGSSTIFSSALAACMFSFSGRYSTTLRYPPSTAESDSLSRMERASFTEMLLCLPSMPMAEYNSDS